MVLRPLAYCRLAQKPTQSFIHGPRTFASNMASSSSNPYPFPVSSNPSPYDIFHLPRDADQAAIKARYYELVKLYHPDAAQSSSQSGRFHKIQTAYAQLRRGGRVTRGRPVGHYPTPSSFNEGRKWTGKYNQWGGFEYEFDERFNARPKPGAAPAFTERKTERVYHEDDKMYWIFGGVAVIGGLAQFIYFSPAAEAARHHSNALAAIHDARRAREEHGASRREQIKRLVSEKRLSAEPGDDASSSPPSQG